MGISKELKEHSAGESFLTKAKRTGIYVAAKRLGMEITTKEAANGYTEVIVVAGTSSRTELSIEERFRVLAPLDRVSEFDNLFNIWEVCCGQRKGMCICPEASPVVENVEPKDNVSVLDALRQSIANIPAKKTDKKIEHPGWKKERTFDYTARCWRTRHFNVITGEEYEEAEEVLEGA